VPERLTADALELAEQTVVPGDEQRAGPEDQKEQHVVGDDRPVVPVPRDALDVRDPAGAHPVRVAGPAQLHVGAPHGARRADGETDDSGTGPTTEALDHVASIAS
jgi:hypothetical protein